MKVKILTMIKYKIPTHNCIAFFLEILSMLMWMDLMRANQSVIPRLPIPSKLKLLKYFHKLLFRHLFKMLESHIFGLCL